MAELPVRIQRKRTKGWRMPENTVYVGRGTVWGNIWRVGLVACGCRSAQCPHNRFRCETAQEAVDAYRDWLGSQPDFSDIRGKNLACWCPIDQPCHADVLLELANREGPTA